MGTDFQSHNFFPSGLSTYLVSHPHSGWAFSSQLLPHIPVLLRNTPQAHPETHITNSRYLSCMPMPEIALAFMVNRKAGVPLNHERTSCIAQVPGECWCSSSLPLGETERSGSLQRHLGDLSPFSCWPTPSSPLPQGNEGDLKLGQRASKAEPWEGLPMLCTGHHAEVDITGAGAAFNLSEKDTHTHFHLTAHEASMY